MQAIYGDCANFFDQVIDSFPMLGSAKARFWQFAPPELNKTWPPSFLAMVTIEQNLDPPAKFAEKFKKVGLPDSPTVYAICDTSYY